MRKILTARWRYGGGRREGLLSPGHSRANRPQWRREHERRLRPQWWNNQFSTTKNVKNFFEKVSRRTFVHQILSSSWDFNFNVWNRLPSFGFIDIFRTVRWETTALLLQNQMSWKNTYKGCFPSARGLLCPNNLWSVLKAANFPRSFPLN